MNPPDEPMHLSLEGLACERGGKPVFAGLGLSLLEGSLLVVQGPNGSGKTSLLMMLAGLIPPAAGAISLGQPDWQPGHEEYLRRMVYIGHRHAVRPEWTVRENIVFWARLRGEEELIGAAIHFFDLQKWLDVRCAELSAGWRHRVALTRLITIPAKLWLLDEPTTHLDEEAIGLLQSLLVKRAERGGIVVMATHSMIANEDIKILNINDYNL